MITIEQALQALGATEWIIFGDSTYDNIQWKNNIILFTEEEVNNKVIELENESVPQPNWNQFISSMEAFFPIGLTANYPVFTQIFNMLLLLRDKKLAPTENNVEWRNFNFNWQLGKPVFTSQQIIEIENAMRSANIPVT